MLDPHAVTIRPALSNASETQIEGGSEPELGLQRAPERSPPVVGVGHPGVVVDVVARVGGHERVLRGDRHLAPIERMRRHRRPLNAGREGGGPEDAMGVAPAEATVRARKTTASASDFRIAGNLHHCLRCVNLTSAKSVHWRGCQPPRHARAAGRGRPAGCRRPLAAAARRCGDAEIAREGFADFSLDAVAERPVSPATCSTTTFRAAGSTYSSRRLTTPAASSTEGWVMDADLPVAERSRQLRAGGRSRAAPRPPPGSCTARRGASPTPRSGRWPAAMATSCLAASPGTSSAAPGPSPLAGWPGGVSGLRRGRSGRGARAPRGARGVRELLVEMLGATVEPSRPHDPKPARLRPYYQVSGSPLLSP